VLPGSLSTTISLLRQCQLKRELSSNEKCNVLPVLNWGRRHESILWNGDIAPHIPTTGNKKSGQLRAWPLYCLRRSLKFLTGLASVLTWTLWTTEKSLTLLVKESLFLSRPTHRLATMPTDLCRLPNSILDIVIYWKCELVMLCNVYLSNSIIWCLLDRASLW